MKKTLMVIDGHALLHRAWHALPPLSTKDGLVVSGAYGFLMILLKAIKEIRPTHLVVTFDLAGPTFRHEEYRDYKATREEKPDELYEQIPIIEEVLDKMDIPQYSAKGFEADDVIGTIACRVRRESPEVEVVIVTGDKDTLQLVEEGVSVYTLRKGMTDTVLYDPAGVEEKMGIRPDQMVDYKALRGDPSDNIPGVRGIGDKTAVSLLSKFDTLEGVYQSLDKEEDGLPKGVRKKLLDGREDAFSSQNLCRIRTDVKLDWNLAAAEYHPVPREEMKETFERYQFNRLLTQLPKTDSEEIRRAGGQLGLLDGGVAEIKTPSVEWVEIYSAEDFERWLSRQEKTRKLSWASFGDLGSDGILALCAGESVAVLTGQKLSTVVSSIEQLMTDQKRDLVCHDLKSETTRLSFLGIEPEASRTFDLMLASYLLHAGERRSSLESLLSFYRNVRIEPVKNWSDEQTMKANLARAVVHFESLSTELKKQLREQELGNVFEDLEMPLTTVLSRVERNGVGLDSDYLRQLSGELEKKIDELTDEIHRLASEKFNINSPVQLKEILFDRLGLETSGIKKTTKGKGLSTAASELVKLRDQHEIVDAILDYRELTKLKSTYVDALPPLVNPQTRRIHASFNQTVTATGRLSSSEPNLQNIPTANSNYGKKVRDSFVAGLGKVFLAADYSQIELRIAAHVADEKNMIEAFRNGEDIHRRTAIEMFGEDEADNKRKIAKAINFGILYGMGSQRLAVSTGLSVTEAKDYIEQYFALHSGIENYILETKEKLSQDGYVETVFGRRRFFPNFHLLNPRERAEVERQAINMPIQGTSADMIKMAMVEIDQEIAHRHGTGKEARVKMVLQVHDELIFEVDEGLVEEVAVMIKKKMEEVAKLKVPILVDLSVGRKWGSMKKKKG